MLVFVFSNMQCQISQEPTTINVAQLVEYSASNTEMAPGECMK